MFRFTVLRLLLYRSVLELFSKSFKVFHCSVINVRCCYFQQLVYFIISSSHCQQLFYFSLLSLFRGNSDILSRLSLFVNNFFLGNLFCRSSISLGFIRSELLCTSQLCYNTTQLEFCQSEITN